MESYAQRILPPELAEDFVMFGLNSETAYC